MDRQVATPELDTLEPPGPETTIAVLLGAGEYPRKPVWSNPVLRRSARAFRDYLRSRSGLALSRRQILDLFDADADPSSQLLRVGDFLAGRVETARDLIVYYVGHGGFHYDEYHLGIRCTQQDREFITTLESRKLAQVIRREFNRRRVYVLLDSCFSASAANDWQGDEIEAAVRKMAQPLPRHGTAFLAAASRYDVTRAPRAGHYTIFTGSVLDALTSGIDSIHPKISMYELYEEVRAVLRRREIDDEGRPELHLPSQAEGDVSRLRLFPNSAYARIEANRESAEAAARIAVARQVGPSVRIGKQSSTGMHRARGVAGSGPRTENGQRASAGPATAHRGTAFLVGAGVAVAATIGITIIDRAISSVSGPEILGALNVDVERLAAILDGAARAAHMRADGIATTPMLRAAIETEAATLSDLATTEMVFTAGRGEVLEVFQFRSERATSLLRIPKTALSVLPLKGRITRFRSDGKSVTLAASAPISGYKPGIGGGLVISSPVDLTSVQLAFSEHASRATLTGLGEDIALVGSGGDVSASLLELTVPSTGDWNASGAKVIVVPKDVGPAWTTPTRVISGGLGALLLIGFVLE